MINERVFRSKNNVEYRYLHYGDVNSSEIKELIGDDETIPLYEHDELFYDDSFYTETYALNDGRYLIKYSSDIFVFSNEFIYSVWMIEAGNVNFAINKYKSKVYASYKGRRIIKIPDELTEVLQDSSLIIEPQGLGKFKYYETMNGLFLAVGLAEGENYIFGLKDVITDSFLEKLQVVEEE